MSRLAVCGVWGRGPQEAYEGDERYLADVLRAGGEVWVPDWDDVRAQVDHEQATDRDRDFEEGA